MPTYNNGAGYFLYVNSISEVYGYNNVPAGGTAFFMNRNQPILYLKSVNMFNQQTVTEYELVEKQLQPQQNIQNTQPIQEPQTVQNNGSNYVTRDELASIVSSAVREELKANRWNRNNRKED